MGADAIGICRASGVATDMSRVSQRAFHAQNKGAPNKGKDRRKRFVLEYLKDMNGTQAAIRAGYSKRTANEQASRLLAKVSVRAEVDRQIEKQAERLHLTADEIISGIAMIARRCEAEGSEFQPFASLKGYELLGKHQKLFTDKVEHSGLEGLAGKVEFIRKRKHA